MPEPTEGPWVASPIINGFPQHPGEIRGPNGPVAYVSLAVPIEQRHATVSVLAAGLEMLKALEMALADGGLRYSTRPMLEAAIAKAKGETPNAEPDTPTFPSCTTQNTLPEPDCDNVADGVLTVVERSSGDPVLERLICQPCVEREIRGWKMQPDGCCWTLIYQSFKGLAEQEEVADA